MRDEPFAVKPEGFQEIPASKMHHRCYHATRTFLTAGALLLAASTAHATLIGDTVTATNLGGSGVTPSSAMRRCPRGCFAVATACTAPYAGVTVRDPPAGCEPR